MCFFTRQKRNRHGRKTPDCGVPLGRSARHNPPLLRWPDILLLVCWAGTWGVAGCEGGDQVGVGGRGGGGGAAGGGEDGGEADGAVRGVGDVVVRAGRAGPGGSSGGGGAKT